MNALVVKVVAMKLTKRRNAINFVAGFSGDLLFLPFLHLCLSPLIYLFFRIYIRIYSLVAATLPQHTGGVAILPGTSSMTLMELRKLVIGEQ
ncbi:unnamed protein product [Hydatigera taeniaeformis]|uniref:G-protein coupled receptors family 1 profile domain-containing protein n=1 Tax=Hydatigena taeniaeformis TaxID=6205 RepID=A0A0R3WTC3_HYDTA|nr:unnamed protein product [Hydatigera taeniaeformis]